MFKSFEISTDLKSLGQACFEIGFTLRSRFWGRRCGAQRNCIKYKKEERTGGEVPSHSLLWNLGEAGIVL